MLFFGLSKIAMEAASSWIAMIKSELISRLCRRFPKVEEAVVADATNALIKKMSESLCNGTRIEIRGFGSFSLHYRPERKAHNPKTGERVKTQAKYSPHFKPGKELKELVDQSKPDEDE